MTSKSLHPEPQKGIEPLTAGAEKLPSQRIPSADEGTTRAVLRASTPEQMQKSDIEERTKSEREFSGAKRPRGRSSGTVPPGYLSEADLAARWSRSTNTLVGWRTRCSDARERIAVELIGGVWCYRVETITAVESDPAFAWIRPLDRRHVPLPPLPYLTFDQAYEDRRRDFATVVRHLTVPTPEPLQPELPLSLPAGYGEVLPAPLGFKALRIEAGYALAIATDDSAWFASVLGGLEFISWRPVAALPQGDDMRARFGRAA